MSFTPILVSIGKTALGVSISRTFGKFMQKISSRIFPLEGSMEKERIDHSARVNAFYAEENQRRNQEFQVRLQEQSFNNQKEIAYMTAMYARQTNYRAALLSLENNLKSELFKDALRNYPFNIPPIVLLKNSGIDTDTLLDSITNTSALFSENTILHRFKNELKYNPITLSVFVTPLQIDSRIGSLQVDSKTISKEKIASMVWDSVYQKTESLLVNEYSRNGERPVVFYPTAWNLNVRPGLHAAEILYFFTKNLPVMVVEPRYDGNQIRIMFSCWGLGTSENDHLRQEMQIELDWNKVIVQSVYERSILGLNEFNFIDNPSKKLLEIKQQLTHNMDVYEKLDIQNKLEKDKMNDILNITDDLSKLFYLNNSDLNIISDSIASSIGISLCVLADMHHLMARDIKPHFPFIYEKYFGDVISQLPDLDKNEFISTLKDTYNMAYEKLILEIPCIRHEKLGDSSEIDTLFNKMLISNNENYQSENILAEELTIEKIGESLKSWCQIHEIPTDISISDILFQMKVLNLPEDSAYIKQLIKIFDANESFDLSKILK